jgi:hypothetical protein
MLQQITNHGLNLDVTGNLNLLEEGIDLNGTMQWSFVIGNGDKAGVASAGRGASNRGLTQKSDPMGRFILILLLCHLNPRIENLEV